MENDKLKKILISSLLLSIFLVPTVNADIEYVSTEDDPLVTLSYVNQMKEQLKAEILAEVKKGNSQTSATEENSLTSEEIKQLISENQSGNYEVVSLSAGQTLMVSTPCEIILRSGEAAAIVTGEENLAQNIGLSDLTAAAEIINGSEIPKNHYLVVPRADGRGVKVTSEIAYFMVRGEYSLVTE